MRNSFVTVSTSTMIESRLLSNAFEHLLIFYNQIRLEFSCHAKFLLIY